MKTKYKIGDKVFMIICDSNYELIVQKLTIESISIEVSKEIIYSFEEITDTMIENELYSTLDEVIDKIGVYYRNDK